MASRLLFDTGTRALTARSGIVNPPDDYPSAGAVGRGCISRHGSRSGGEWLCGTAEQSRPSSM